MIDIQNLCVTLNHRKVLNEISLVFRSGIYYLTGLNGSGKTTLLRTLSGLLPYTGSVVLDGKELSHTPANRVAHRIAFVPQRLDVPFDINVYDFLLTGRYPYLNWLGDYSASDHQIVADVIRQLTLEDYTSRNLREISGGELQKVMLGRALIQQTPVLVLDEPAQSLDPKNKSFLFSFLKSLAVQGKTIICSTHDLEPLDDPEVWVTAIREGKVVFSERGGDLRKILMEEVYF
ncbi:MAG: ABC transporter ATP-binding protein [Bacteroidia bacterium]